VKGILLFQIQTAESAAINIVQQLGYYTIKEIDGYAEPDYWSFDCISIDDCFDILENYKFTDWCWRRDYKSWWLFAPVMVLDESLKNYVFNKVKKYNENGLVEEAYLNRFETNDHYRKELNEWLKRISISGLYNLNDIDLNRNQYPSKEFIIFFYGFNLPILKSITLLKIESNANLQSLLNQIYFMISSEVPPNSYEEKWILLDFNNQFYIKKSTRSNFGDSINRFDSYLICKKNKHIFQKNSTNHGYIYF
jgi:hypothetical protein